jgi:trimethylamine--corrinoid protein Co-methyltransferase
MRHPYPTYVDNFRVLTNQQCQQIHLASLEILAYMGIRIHDGGAIDLLKENGVDIVNGNLARFPERLVEWAVRNTPPRVILWNRNGQPTMRLQERNVHFGTGSDCPYILDTFTGERRKFLKEDVENGMRVCDYLPNIDFVLSMGLISDVSESVSDLHQFDAMIRKTAKPAVFTAHNVTNCRSIVEMAEIVAGGADALRQRPQVALFTETISPLQIAEETAQKLLYMAEKHLPVVLSSGPMMGASGPQTHAGILALANAEVLAGNVLAQLVRPGAPIIYALGIHPLDMQTTVLPYGAPELSLNTAAAADMARFYGMPVWGYAGCSDAKTLDQQAAMEGTGSIIMSLLAGNHLVHDVAYLESGLTSSFDMLVLSDTAIEMGRNLFKPIRIEPETLALEVIERVGVAGNYLGDEHTHAHFREVWYHDLVDHRNYERWIERGGLTMGDRIKAKVQEILDTHHPEPLSEAVQVEFEKRLRQGEADAAAVGVV